MKPTETETHEQIDIAHCERDNGSKFPGMSYEDGVIAALEWVLGIVSTKPMDE